jgi:thiamine-phosphate diphosphorylase
MRPVPRLHAFTDARVLADPDLGRKAAAIAAIGPGAALHLRDRTATTAQLAEFGRRLGALVRPAESALIVNARADLAAALGAQGLQLGSEDLGTEDARRVFSKGWIGRSVHSIDEARREVEAGADFLVVGHVYATPSHPEREPIGLKILKECATLGRPVIAIGGVTKENASACRDVGAYGVAAIRAVWDADDPYAAGLELLAAWEE